MRALQTSAPDPAVLAAENAVLRNASLARCWPNIEVPANVTCIQAEVNAIGQSLVAVGALTYTETGNLINGDWAVDVRIAVNQDCPTALITIGASGGECAPLSRLCHAFATPLGHSWPHAPRRARFTLIARAPRTRAPHAQTRKVPFQLCSVCPRRADPGHSGRCGRHDQCGRARRVLLFRRRRFHLQPDMRLVVQRAHLQRGKLLHLHHVRGRPRELVLCLMVQPVHVRLERVPGLRHLHVGQRGLLLPLLVQCVHLRHRTHLVRPLRRLRPGKRRLVLRQLVQRLDLRYWRLCGLLQLRDWLRRYRRYTIG